MTNQAATRPASTGDEVAQCLLDRQIKPERPADWCLPQWCAVRPLTSGGALETWQGWHCAEQHITNLEYGFVAGVSAAAAVDESDHIEVRLHLMARQTAEDFETALTPDEADQLADALRAGARDAREIRAIQEVRR